MRLLLSALLVSAAAAQGSSVPAIDKSVVSPVLDKSWSAGESCGQDPVDFAIDTDGQPYLRANGSYTPLTVFTLKDGQLTIADDVGIGRTTSIYTLGADGGLRLWSEIYDPTFGEEGQKGEPVTARVKDGMIVIDDEGQPLSPGKPTPDLKPCAPRTELFAADIVSALEGTWATGDGKGGICAKDADSVTFELSRPVPRVLRGPFGGEAVSTSYALNIAKNGAAFAVTEGDAFGADDYTFTPDSDGGLTQANPYADGPLKLHRCP